MATMLCFAAKLGITTALERPAVQSTRRRAAERGARALRQDLVVCENLPTTFLSMVACSILLSLLFSLTLHTYAYCIYDAVSLLATTLIITSCASTGFGLLFGINSKAYIKCKFHTSFFVLYKTEIRLDY